MTDAVLNDYYDKHKDIYMSIVRRCTSVQEVLLKISIFGLRWNCWDWALMLSCLFNQMAIARMSSNIENSCYLLYDELLETVDETDLLDKVVTSKLVVLNVIHVINSRAKFVSSPLREELCVFLAHIFKKFPKMWSMSWMYAKYRDGMQKKWQKYHRLKNAVRHSACSPYADASEQMYSDFIRKYFRCRRADDEES